MTASKPFGEMSTQVTLLKSIAETSAKQAQRLCAPTAAIGAFDESHFNVLAQGREAIHRTLN